MAKFKNCNYGQMAIISTTLKEQPGSGVLEFAIHELVETEINPSFFETRFENDDTGLLHSPRKSEKIELKNKKRMASSVF